MLFKENKKKKKYIYIYIYIEREREREIDTNNIYLFEKCVAGNQESWEIYHGVYFNSVFELGLQIFFFCLCHSSQIIVGMCDLCVANYIYIYVCVCVRVCVCVCVCVWVWLPTEPEKI